MFGKLSDFLKILWPETWDLGHWLHCWLLKKKNSIINNHIVTFEKRVTGTAFAILAMFLSWSKEVQLIEKRVGRGYFHSRKLPAEVIVPPSTIHMKRSNIYDDEDEGQQQWKQCRWLWLFAKEAKGKGGAAVDVGGPHSHVLRSLTPGYHSFRF